jgi:pSer/pThr/pTyr-binding forkhead associated (FHA) protein
MEQQEFVPPLPVGEGSPSAPESPLSQAVEKTQVSVPVVCPVCQTSNLPGELYCQECGFLLSAVPGEKPSEVVPARGQLKTPEGVLYPLREGENRIGRTEGEILLQNPSVSRRHALLRIEGNRATLEDLGSTNGTFIGGKRIPPHQPVSLRSGDEIRLGDVLLLFTAEGLEETEPPSEEGFGPTAETSSGAYLEAEDGTRYPIPVGVSTLGRRPENQIVIPDPYVSGRHLEISYEEGMIYLRDLNSTNGTFLNDNRVPPGERVLLSQGDVLVVGKQRLKVVISEERKPEEGSPREESEEGGF